MNSAPLSSEPLSESMPRIGNANTARASSRPSTMLRFTVQPVAISVTVRVKQNSPKLLPPSWPTRSISPSRRSIGTTSAGIVANRFVTARRCPNERSIDQA